VSDAVRRARAVMVWGTSSGAGKSWLTTALCRWAAQRGLRVAPFKAQNMSNNARVVPAADGSWGEIGAAQYFQALAARVAPTVDMNPVLLKPERDTASQVVLHGRVHHALSAVPWRERSDRLASAARQSLQRLQAAHDLLLIEGAGSPAEINLAPHDYVNLATARWAKARCLLVADIDRGGAFAHLFGTWALLPEDLKGSLAGFVLSKFRGDPALLAPGPEQLRVLTGVPTLALLPMSRQHGLPEEDGVFDDPVSVTRGAGGSPRVAVVAYPRISNLDEFQPLRQVPGLCLVWARHPADLAGADWIVLPGSKQVSGDLAWLREQGLDQAIAHHAAAGRPVLGICGGLQMLGEALVDPDGADGERGLNGPGLGLLPLVTCFDRHKTVRRTALRFGATTGSWAALAGVDAEHGYEIRHGQSVPHPDMAAPLVALCDAAGQAVGWQAGSVLGLSAHGIFESAPVLRALFGATVPTLDAAFDGLADLIDDHFDAGALERLLIGGSA
jgi:adenosylcobyric acid synthase